MSDFNRCLGCMEPLTGDPCPLCGYLKGAAPASPLHLQPGTVLREQYVVGRVLGHGGFGITYLGWDIHLACKIAVKEYFPMGVAMRTGPTSRVFAHSTHVGQEFQLGLERYIEEARTIRRFSNHPNIIWVQNFFPDNGTAYIILEYLDGRTFDEFLAARGGKVDWTTAMQVMAPVMDALREVHRAGVLHRDISPDNIYLVRNGPVKVIDFGAAREAVGRASRNLSVILKQGYAPLEQYQTKGVQGPWTDVYATAGTLYRALTGEVPPPAPDRHLGEELVPPSRTGAKIAAHHEEALLRGLALSIPQRWQTMEEFQNAVMSAAAAASNSGVVVAPPERDLPDPKRTPAVDPVLPLPAPPPPPSPAPVPPTPKPRSWWLLALAAFTVVAVIAAVTGSLLTKKPEIRAFTVSTARIQAGGSATLQWDVADAKEVRIDGIDGVQPGRGQLRVTPSSTTRYRLIANPGKPDETTRETEIVVDPTSSVAEIATFSADREAVQAGENVTLRWSVKGASTVLLNNAPVYPEGAAQVRVDATSRYLIVAKDAQGQESRREVVVSVLPSTPRERIPPRTASAVEIKVFEFDPPTVRAGQPTMLRWDVRNATTVNIDGLGRVPSSGERQATPQRSAVVRMTAQGEGGSATGTAAVSVSPAQNVAPPVVSAPVISQFSAQPTSVRPGQPVTLSWSVSGATRVLISPEPGNVTPSGSIEVQPQRSMRYVLTAWGADGRQVQDAAEVAMAVAPPTIRPQPGREFPVRHDHDGKVGIIIRREWAFCEGVLRIDGNDLVFQSPRDGFRVPLNQLVSTRANFMNIRNQPAFHIKVSGKTYNFVPIRHAPQQVVNALEDAGAR